MLAGLAPDPQPLVRVDEPGKRRRLPHRPGMLAFIDEKGQKVVGKSDLHVVFTNKMLLVAIGPQSKHVLQKAVNSKPADVGVAQFSVALARIVPILDDNAEQLAAAKKAAEKVFGKGASKADEIRFSIDGGESLKIKLMAKGKAIAFLVELGLNAREN